MVRNMSKNGIEEKKKPSFFRILFSGVNTEHLRIPTKFLKHIMHELSEKATLKLKVSSDFSWTVKAHKTEKNVYFKDGWQEFLKDNSLCDNEFLRFSYDGKMHFSIDVFDKSACEVFGFPNIKAHQNPTIAKRPRGRPRKHHVPVCTSEPSSPSKTCKDDSDESLPSSESSELEEFSEEEEDSEGNTTEDSEAAKPETVKSKYPYFGAVFTEPSSVFVPTAFSRVHFPRRKDFDIILKNAERKEWSVRAVSRLGTHMISAGWRKFAFSNQITLGDTCLFELVSRSKLRVCILQKGSV